MLLHILKTKIPLKEPNTDIQTANNQIVISQVSVVSSWAETQVLIACTRLEHHSCYGGAGFHRFGCFTSSKKTP